MKPIILSIFAAICLTVATNAAPVVKVNNINSHAKTFTEKAVKDNFTIYTVSYTVNKTFDWYEATWTLTIHWNDGTQTVLTGTVIANSYDGAIAAAEQAAEEAKTKVIAQKQQSTLNSATN